MEALSLEEMIEASPLGDSGDGDDDTYDGEDDIKNGDKDNDGDNGSEESF